VVTGTGIPMEQAPCYRLGMLFLAWPMSDVGRVRSYNEDSYLVDDTLGLYIVADGMGNHAGGALASRTAVNVVSDVVRRGLVGLSGLPPQAIDKTLCDLLTAAAREASATIYDHGLRDPALHGMGTTLCGVLFYEDRGYIVHVGDSRTYLLRQGTAQQLTSDHSWLNEQVSAGLLTPEEAAMSDFKHIITRSVGFERDVDADIVKVNVAQGDAFLLCSDGLCNYIEGDELAELARDHFYEDLPRVCTELALERGGDDNITVVVIAAVNDHDVRSPPTERRVGTDTLPPT